MAKIELRIVHEEQSHNDTMKMFLWGDGFLAHVYHNGVDTGRTTILRVEEVRRLDGHRNVIFFTNHGRFTGLWPFLEQIE